MILTNYKVEDINTAVKPDIFLQKLQNHYIEEYTLIPHHYGNVQYHFVKWLKNGNFQFIGDGLIRMSISKKILLSVIAAYNRQEVTVDNIKDWCLEVHGMPASGIITVLKNLLIEFM